MLIKIYNDELVQLPDDLATLILASPLVGNDVPNYTLEEVNAVVHGILGTFFEEEATLAQNIAEVREIYAARPAPCHANLEKAAALIANYNQQIAPADIGRVSDYLVFPCGGNDYPAHRGYVIEQVATAPAVTNAPATGQPGGQVSKIP